MFTATSNGSELNKNPCAQQLLMEYTSTFNGYELVNSRFTATCNGSEVTNFMFNKF